MSIYSIRSSTPQPSSTKNVASKGVLVAVSILIIIVPIGFIAALSYMTQPFTGSNEPSSSSPWSPFGSSYPEYTLSEAISAGYVEATITGVSGLTLGLPTSGACSGDVIILHITRLTNETIEITPFPTGTLLVPDSSSAPNMAVLKLQGIEVGAGYHKMRTQIILDTSEPVEYLYSAYCLDITKNNPNASTVFTQNGMADPNVIKIFTAVDELPSSTTTITAIQTAVFAVTNNVSPSELAANFTSNTTEIQNAKIILEQAGIDTTTLKLYQ
jgi:hypothetical protein